MASSKSSKPSARRPGKPLPARRLVPPEELPDVWAARNLVGGERPEGRLFAKSYREVAEAFGCTVDAAALACARAARLHGDGLIIQIGDRCSYAPGAAWPRL